MIRRSKPISQGPGPTRKTPIKKKRRPKSEDLRIYGPPEFREWLHRQPCAICGNQGYAEQAHAQTGGVARKDDWQRTFPACGPHWVRPKGIGIKFDMLVSCHAMQPNKETRLRLAAETYSRWLAFRAGARFQAEGGTQ